jgi:Transcription elongation factor
MNQPIFLTKAAFDSLLSNLLEVEEGIAEVIDKFFSKPSRETEELKQLLNEYVRRLDSVLRNISIIPTAANYFPYVAVGGEIVIRETASGETYCYKLVSPLKNSIGINQISFLSPMGKALLLKKVNDNFSVEAPGGNCEYKVLSVRIAADS